MAPVYFCMCTNCNCTATVLSINTRAMVIPPIPSADLIINTPTYAFSTFSMLPANNSKYVWQEETHRIRSLVEVAGEMNLEVEKSVEPAEQSQPNLLEVVFILAVAASTAVGKHLLAEYMANAKMELSN